jgi:hypothetical protein
LIFGGVVVDDANVVVVVVVAVTFDATVVLAVPSDIGSVALLCTVVEVEFDVDVDIDVVVVVVFIVVVVVTALWFKTLLLGIVLLKFFFSINYFRKETPVLVSLLIRNNKYSFYFNF